MLCGILVVQIKGWHMKKGLTLIEVILSISLVSMIAISFLPGMVFGYKNVFEARKFTEDIFESQAEIERIMEEKRKEVATPDGTNSYSIFGVNVVGHNIEIPVEDHGEIHVFQPEKKEDYPVPNIVRNTHSGLTNIVRLSVFNNSTEVTPPPASVNMFNASNVLDSSRNFLVDSKYYKIDNPRIHLVNVYRWYTSSMVEYTADFEMDNYFIIKEWNAARALVSYEESKTLKAIPNIQNSPDYNRLSFTEIRDGLGLSNAELINQFGNRYYYFSVTPFAVSGKIGPEEYSNAVYVKAPRIEISKAVYGPYENQVSIYFKDSIADNFVIDKMSFNESLGRIENVSRYNGNDKIMIVEFDRALNPDIEVEGNVLHLGSVQSSKFGAIYIWSPDNVPSGEFKIVKPVPVKEWNFDTHTEGWSAQNHIDSFTWHAGGYVGGNINGNDPYFHSPSDLNINTDNVNWIRIRLKNNSTSNTAQIFYNTSAGGWSEARHTDFPITPNSDFKDYIIDVGSLASWSGTLKQLRIDPTVGVATGSFSIDYIRFYE
jgi:type II secretory pathway pseudopilin PulG